MSESSLTACSLIRSEIERDGPILFERFMDLALYAPGAGYYVRERDPFGAAGDYFTASQLQPVFGTLIAQYVAELCEQLNSPPGFQIVELGAGRGQMAAAFERFGYVPVDVNRGELPRVITGVVFANEFFDALPVTLIARRKGVFRNVRVAFADGRFAFIDGEPAGGDVLAYLCRYYPAAGDDSLIEVHLRALAWLDRIRSALSGYLVIIDYGYTAREWIRHAGGTLMSYQRHIATGNVLDEPGNRDITAHVPFTVLEQHAHERGFAASRFETLASFLLSVGEKDSFEAALRAGSESEAFRRRMQLKTLLYSMGETFRVLVLRSGATQ